MFIPDKAPRFVSFERKRKVILIPILLLIILSCECFANRKDSGLDLMPYPKKLEQLDGEVSIGIDQKIKITTKSSGKVKKVNASSLEHVRNMFRKIGFEGGIINGNKPHTTQEAALQIFINLKHEKAVEKKTFVDESYSLFIRNKKIDIQCSNHVGLNHALATLSQLAITKNNIITFPQVNIQDSPRFAWRGLLLDSARHFFEVETIKRQIDGMAAAKLNVLHWHLTDDQGWRYESKKFPLLTDLGSNEKYYTQEDIREIVSYAKTRGIHVLPEIDMPGHTSALALAYPQLMSLNKTYSPEDRWGVHTPLMDPSNEEVYIFIDALFAELTSLFPFPYVHIGGDEVNPHDWQQSSRIQQFMQQKNLNTTHELQLYFNSRVNEILKKHDRHLVGWDEILTPGLPKDALIQSWQGRESLFNAANAGYKALLSTGYYLDQPQPSNYHYRNDPIIDHAEEGSLATKTKTEYWSFAIPRKRGSDITGTLAIQKAGAKTNAFVQFKGKSQRLISNIENVFDQYWFSLDTWMGPTRFQISTDNTLNGEVKVGNALYTITGNKSDAFKLKPVKHTLKPMQQSNVLGGEIALWSELIDEDSIDTRLWPRAFVVAERLWSPAILNDENFMYQRLKSVSNWAENHIGLQHHQQLNNRIAELSKNKTEIQKHISVMIETLEPAQYYHRHHEKSAYASYSRKDPLNKLADVLPAENLQTRELNIRLKKLLGDDKLEEGLLFLHKHVIRWQQSARNISKEKNKAYLGQDILPIAQAVNEYTDFVLSVISLTQENLSQASAINGENGNSNKLQAKASTNLSRIDSSKIKALQQELSTHQKMNEETVISATILMETLLIYLWQSQH